MNTAIAFMMPGGAEWVIIFLVLLLLFGAKKLPDLARGIGRSLGEFRKAKDEFEHEISYGEEQARREEERRRDEERRRKFAESRKAAQEAEAKAVIGEGGNGDGGTGAKAGGQTAAGSQSGDD